MLRIGSFFFPPLKSIAIYLIIKKKMNLRKSRKVPVCSDCLLLCLLHDLFHGIALDVKSLCGIAHSLIDSVIYLAEGLDIEGNSVEEIMKAAEEEAVRTYRNFA